MPLEIYITKRDGEDAGPMKQPQAEKYLANVINDPSLASNLKQSLNDLYSGKGKPTGHYLHGKLPIKHASSGVEGTKKCVSLFWTDGPAQLPKIVAAGRHLKGTPNVTKYELCFYGQADGDMKEGKKVELKS